MKTPGYESTKKFLDWLAEVRPGYEVKSIHALYRTPKGKVVECVQDVDGNIVLGEDNEYYYTEHEEYKWLCDSITLESLHTILWELFDVELVEEVHYDPFGHFGSGQYYKVSNEKFTADRLWQKYTNGKESLWLTDPDKCLEDIMKTYNKLNK